MSRNIVLKKKNEVYFELELDKAQSMELNTYMAKKAENYLYSPTYRQGRWDGSIYFFNRITNELPIGLLPQFITFCEEFRYPFIFDFDHTTLSGNVTEEKMEKVYDFLFPPELNFYPRDYQQEAILSALKNKRSVSALATSSGKCNFYGAEIEIEIDEETYNKIIKNRKHTIVEE